MPLWIEDNFRRHGSGKAFGFPFVDDVQFGDAMWIRMRFGIGWRDLAAGIGFCLRPGSRPSAYEAAVRSWNEEDECLITLSVRSAFDLMLQELSLERGDEVLMSAWTVPDMIRIVEAHGLVTVPVDVDHRGVPDLDSLRNAISNRTRVCVIAHLFGGKSDLEQAIQILHDDDVLMVEDCAQSFQHVGDSGHPQSDLVLHSFGPIKTATALGGAVARVSDPVLRSKMKRRMESYPTQSRFRFAKRVLRFAVLKFLSGRVTSAILFGTLAALKIDADEFVNSLAKGFPGSDILAQIRIQPSVPLLNLLRRRFANFDPVEIDRRKALGRKFDAVVGEPEKPSSHSRWICPVFVEDPDRVCEEFREAGFDATARSRMAVVPAARKCRFATMASANWERVVFLPWYPDLSEDAVCQMAEIVRNSTPAKICVQDKSYSNESRNCRISPAACESP